MAFHCVLKFSILEGVDIQSTSWTAGTRGRVTGNDWKKLKYLAVHLILKIKSKFKYQIAAATVISAIS